MSESGLNYIPVTRLRVGMFIELELDWMSHPFSLNRFKIRSQSQIDTLTAIGVEKVLFDPSRSDASPLEVAEPSVQTVAAEAELLNLADKEITKKVNLISKEEADAKALDLLEKKYTESCRIFKVLSKEALSSPTNAKEKAEQLGSMLFEQIQAEHIAIRLLADRTGEEFTLHNMNVAVLSTLLAKQMGLADEQIKLVATAALLHDIGKLSLPDRLRFHNMHLSSAEKNLLKEHVSKGVEMGKQMGLSHHILLAIGQHHELADGSGYPLGINVHRMTGEAKILALINRYDNLCNTGVLTESLTPHEALRTIFATSRHEFDEGLLAAFVKLMGIYPPGSIVRLTDDRMAMVTSVNPKQPLRPVVLVYDEKAPRERAPMINLEDAPEISIRQAIKPGTLPKAIFDYLAPRRQLVYFIQKIESDDLSEA